jgi:putative SOS response-associated peptidase YedK
MLTLCYHTSLARSPDYLEKRFQAKIEQPSLFEPIYHHSGFSAPLHPVIANESIQSISFFRWGLVPFWTKDESAAERIRTHTLNAKAETIHQKPSFRSSIMTKRCLVLVDGFYEWREEGGKKYPNPLLERIHNTRKRMPVILKQADERKWLDKDLDRTAIDGLFQPYDDKEMRAHTVSRLVSTKRANTNVPEVMREFSYEGLDP